MSNKLTKRFSVINHILMRNFIVITTLILYSCFAFGQTPIVTDRIEAENKATILKMINSDYSSGSASLSTKGKLAIALDYNDNDNDAEFVIGRDAEDPSKTGWEELFRVSNYGNVHLVEDVEVVFGSSANSIRERSNSLEFVSHNDMRFYIDEFQNSSDDKFQVFGNKTEGEIHGALFTVVEDGKVGIGTDNPDSELTVNGKIHCKEVLIDTDFESVPDYVFEDSYNLMSLEDTKFYIDQNKHLPEVPSATEMSQDGVDLLKMNMILLKKVEELTLHQIELLERIKKLENID